MRGGYVLEKQSLTKQLLQREVSLEKAKSDKRAMQKEIDMHTATIEASAQDLPELGELWYAGTRGGLIGRLTQYLEARMASGDLRTLPDARVGARMLTQLIYWFAVQRFYDPSPEDMSEGAVRQSVREAALGFCGVAT